MTRGSDRDADRRLVARCVDGEAEAWAELVSQYETTIFFAVRSALTLRQAPPNVELVEDLVSEIFYRLVRRGGRRLAQYSGRSSLKHWLKVVAGNFVIDYLRKRRADYSLDDPDLSALRDNLPARTTLPDAALLARRRRSLLRQLWDELGETDRQFVELYYEQELDYDAVAERLNTTVAAVYTRKNRVTSKLRGALRRRRQRERHLRSRRATKAKESGS